MCHVWVCQRWQLFSFAKKAQDSKVKSTAVVLCCLNYLELVSLCYLVTYSLELKTAAMCLVYIRFRRSNFSYFHIQSNSYGLAVIPSFLMYIYSAHQLVIYLLVALLSVGVCYALTSLFAIPQVLISDKVIEEEEREVFEMQHNTLDEQLFLR